MEESSDNEYHDKPEVLAVSGKKPSSLVKSSLETFKLSISSFEVDFRLRSDAGFLALCISLHFEPLEHLPVIKNSSHSKMCFLLHCQTKKKRSPIRHHQLFCLFVWLFFVFFFFDNTAKSTTVDSRETGTNPVANQQSDCFYNKPARQFLCPPTLHIHCNLVAEIINLFTSTWDVPGILFFS